MFNCRQALDVYVLNSSNKRPFQRAVPLAECKDVVTLKKYFKNQFKFSESCQHFYKLKGDNMQPLKDEYKLGNLSADECTCLYYIPPKNDGKKNETEFSSWLQKFGDSDLQYPGS